MLARGSVASGLLAGKPPKAYLNYNEAQIAAAAKEVARYTEREKSTAATAIRYALHHPAITAAIVGIRTDQQLAEALQAVQERPLSDQQIQALEASIPANYYEQHR